MQLFIIGYDPLIKFISASLSPIDHILLPYCDDIAIAIYNVVRGWQILLDCFKIIHKVAALLLNTDKTQFLLTSHSTKIQDAHDIMNFDSTLSSGQFLPCLKYLGIFIGPDSCDENWNVVKCDYLATSRFIASLDCGLLTKISLYNMLAIAKLSYVASFLPPSEEILKAENRALQTLCRGPWNAIPPKLLKSTRQIGMPSQATDLTFLSIASKVRVAHLTSQNVFQKDEQIDSLYGGFDIVCKYLDHKFTNSSTIKSICNAYRDFAGANGSVVDGNSAFSQKKVYKQLQANATPFCFRSFVSLKAGRILGYTPDEAPVTKVIETYKFASSKSYALTFTHIRTISNHWCTRSRFGAKHQGCAFACGHETDAIKHSCVCPAFWETFFHVSKIPSFCISLENIMTFSHNSIPIPDFEVKSIVLGLHICFLCFHSCIHGKELSERLLQFHLSHFMRQHYEASLVLRGLQQEE